LSTELPRTERGTLKNCLPKLIETIEQFEKIISESSPRDDLSRPRLNFIPRERLIIKPLMDTDEDGSVSQKICLVSLDENVRGGYDTTVH
jgi:hypothetical protein